MLNLNGAYSGQKNDTENDQHDAEGVSDNSVLSIESLPKKLVHKNLVAEYDPVCQARNSRVVDLNPNTADFY